MLKKAVWGIGIIMIALYTMCYAREYTAGYIPSSCTEYVACGMPRPDYMRIRYDWGKQKARILITCEGCNTKITPAYGVPTFPDIASWDPPNLPCGCVRGYVGLLWDTPTFYASIYNETYYSVSYDYGSCSVNLNTTEYCNTTENIGRVRVYAKTEYEVTARWDSLHYYSCFYDCAYDDGSESRFCGPVTRVATVGVSNRCGKKRFCNSIGMPYPPAPGL